MDRHQFRQSYVFERSASTFVVPLPANGSRIQSFSWEYRLMSQRGNSGKNLAGYLCKPCVRKLWSWLMNRNLSPSFAGRSIGISPSTSNNAFTKVIYNFSNVVHHYHHQVSRRQRHPGFCRHLKLKALDCQPSRLLLIRMHRLEQALMFSLFS